MLTYHASKSCEVCKETDCKVVQLHRQVVLKVKDNLGYVPSWLRCLCKCHASDNKEILLADPSVSYWLKEAIIKLDERNVVDTINDLTLLLKYFKSQIGE